MDIDKYPGGLNMIILPSRLKNTVVAYLHARSQLSSRGYVVGGNWDCEMGYFDYVLDDSTRTNYLRIPFYACKGSIEDKNGIIRMGNPYLLSEYDKMGLASSIREKNEQGMTVSSINRGMELLEQAEEVLLGS
ncbi:YugN family protein [Pradoshia sp.]